MRKGFPILSAGSANCELFLKVNGKYVDRPLFSLKPFPTIFKWSVFRHIEGLELVYRRAIPSLRPEMHSLAGRLSKKYVLNTKKLANTYLFVQPKLNFSICLPEVSLEGVTHSPLSREPPRLTQEICSHKLSNYIPNFNRGPLAESVRSSHPGHKFPVIFQRGSAAFHDEVQQRRGSVRWNNVDLGGADRLPMVESADRSQMIIRRAPVPLHEERVKDTFSQRSKVKETRTALEETDHLPMAESADRSQMIIRRAPVPLHEERVKDTFSQRSKVKETRTALEETDHLPMAESADRSQMIIHRAPTVIHEVFSEIFKISPEMAASSTIIDPTSMIVRREPALINKPSFSKKDDLKMVSLQISEANVENLHSLEFAENLQGSPIVSDLRKIYQRYPKMEHVEPVQTKIVKGREVLKENSPELELDQKLIDSNLNRISDQVYSMIEKRIRIERERRGLYDA